MGILTNCLKTSPRENRTEKAGARLVCGSPFEPSPLMVPLTMLAGALGFASSGPFFSPTAGAFAWSPAAAAAAVPVRETPPQARAITYTPGPSTAKEAVGASCLGRARRARRAHSAKDTTINASPCSPPRLRAFPPFQALPVREAVVQPSPSAIVSNLLSSALQWGLASCSEADDVMLALVSPEAYWLLREWRASTFGDQMAIRGMLHNARSDLLRLGKSEEALRGASVSVRTKGLFSTFHKAVVRKQHVHDVLALRVVLRRGVSADGCFDAHARLRQRWGSVSGRHKDYVSAPKRNGYQALHDTMVLPSGHEFECQIRTDEMHREAEFGYAAHRRYKGALVRLPAAVISGLAGAAGRWPLQPQEALGLAARIAQ